MALNNLGLGIGVNVTGNAQQKFGGIGGAFSNFTSMIPTSVSGLGNLITKFGPLALGIGAAVVALTKLVALIGEGIERARSFEKGLAEVSTLLGSDQMHLMPKIADDTLRLSSAFAKSTEDLNQATYQAISAGVAAEEAASFLDTAGKLAVGGVTDMTTAVDGLTSIKNAWGLDITEMADVSDKMFVAMKAGKTTIGELSSSIGKVAPIAANMGVELKEVLSMTAAITKGGLTTSEAMTGIRSAMIAVMRQSPIFTKAAKKYGIAYDKATVQGMGFSNWLVMANEKITAGGGKLSDMFRNVQGLTAALALTGKQMKDNNEIMAAMNNSAGQTDIAFAKMAQTYDFIVGQMEQTKDSFMIKIGQMFLPMAKGWALAKTEFWDIMTSFVDIIQDSVVGPLSDALKPFIATLITIWGVIKPILGTLIMIVFKVGKYIFKWLLTPFKLVASALFALFAGVASVFNRLFAALGRVGQAFKPVFDAFEKLWVKIKEIGKIFGLGGGGSIFSTIFSEIGKAVFWVFDKIAMVLEFILPYVAKVAELIVGILLKVPEAIAWVYQKFMNSIVKFAFVVARGALMASKPVFFLLEKIGKVEKGTYGRTVAQLEQWKENRIQGIEGTANKIRNVFGENMKDAVKDGMEARDEMRDKQGKDKTNVNVNNTVNVGGKKLHESQKDWEEQFLLRNFVPVR